MKEVKTTIVPTGKETIFHVKIYFTKSNILQLQNNPYFVSTLPIHIPTILDERTTKSGDTQEDNVTSRDELNETTSIDLGGRYNISL